MKNFALNFFGKNIKDISQDDLTTYFTQPRSEADNLEFKSYPPTADFEKSLQKILKTVCAFLNSSGGMIIWGAPVGSRPNGETEDIFTGNLLPVTTVKGQDWLINKISSSISPMPKDIQINIITIGTAAVYLIEVQESQFKPHQFENLYQIRLDGQNKPAPHYIVQSLMREIKYPDIRGIIGFRPANKFENGEILIWLRVAFFNFSPFQNEFDVNYRIVLVGAEFGGWDENTDDNIIYQMNGSGLTHKAFTHPLYYGMPNVRSYRVYPKKGIKELTILLTFGGKLSPAKICTYTLDIENFDFANPANSLILCEENMLFEEKQSIDETIAFFKSNPI